MAELRIEKVENKTMFKIIHPGVGGSLPDALKGHFTTPTEAEKAIRSLRAKIHSKAKKTGSGKRGNSTESKPGS